MNNLLFYTFFVIFTNNLFSFELVNLSYYFNEKSLADKFFLERKKDDVFFINFSERFGDVSFRFREEGNRLKIQRCTVLTKNQENKVQRSEVLVNDKLNDDFRKVIVIVRKISAEPSKFLVKNTMPTLDSTHFHLLIKQDTHNSLSGLQFESNTNLTLSHSLPDIFALLQEMFLNSDLDPSDFEKRFKQAVLQAEKDLVEHLKGNHNIPSTGVQDTLLEIGEVYEKATQ